MLSSRLFRIAVFLAALIFPFSPRLRAEAGMFLRIEPGGHTAEVRKVLFTLDGGGLISLGKDKVVRIWDLRSGRQTRTFRYQIGSGPDGQLFAGALSSNKETPILAVGEYADDAGIFLFDVASGKLLRRLSGTRELVTGLAFSPDNQRLASTGADAVVRMWNPNTGKLLWKSPKIVSRSGSKRHGSATETPVYLYGVAYSPNGQEIATAGDDGKVRIWSAASGKEIASTEGEEEITCLAYAPNGGLAYGTRQGAIHLWNRAAGSIERLYRQDDAVDCLAFSPNGQQLVSGGGERFKDMAIRLWSVPDRRLLGEFRHHSATVLSVAFSPEGETVASGDASGRILIWSPRSENRPRQLWGVGAIPQTVAWSRDGQQIAWGTDRMRPVRRAFDLRKAAPVPWIVRGDGWLTAAQDEHDGLRLRQESLYGPIFVRDKNGREVGRIDPQNGDQIKCFAFTPKGRVVVGSDIGGLTLWDLQNNKPRLVCRMEGHQGTVLAVSVSPQGRYVASASADQTVRIWNLAEITVTGGKEPIPILEPLLSLFQGSDNEWIAWNEHTGYYTASAAGDDILGWQINRGPDRNAELYSAFQFRKQFYRPDIISRLVETGSVSAAQKRAAEVAPMGDRMPGAATLAEEIPRVPRVEIVRVEAATPQQDGFLAAAPSVQIHVRVTNAAGDPIQDPRSVQLDLRVNRPVARRRLQEISAASQPGEWRLPATLRYGENTVSVVARNDAGESAPATIRVTCTAPLVKSARRNLYLLAVGVSAYTADKRIPSLNFAANDAQTLAAFYKEQQGRRFDTVEVVQITDADATRDRFLEEMAKMGQRMASGDFDDDSGDLVILFVSSHGFAARGHFYFAPTDARLADLAGTGVEWGQILARLQALPCANVLLILDHCYSGGVNREILRSLDDPDDERSRGFRPEDAALRETRQQNILTFTASASYQESFEHSSFDGGHGAFTAALLRALRGQGAQTAAPEGVVLLNRIEDFVYDEVSAMIRAAFGEGVEQRPSLYCPPDMDKRIPLAQAR